MSGSGTFGPGRSTGGATYRVGMIAARAGVPAALRAAAIAVVAGVTTAAAHLLVTGEGPGALALLAGVMLAGAAARGLDIRAVPRWGTLLVAQLAVHAVLAVTQPVGCLRAVGRAAWAGADLARWGASAACDPAQLLVAGSPERTALLTVASVVLLLAGHAVTAAAGAAGVGSVERAVHCVLALVSAVLVVLPGAVRLPALRPLTAARGSSRVWQARLVPLRPVVRRGPPTAALA